MKHWPESWGHLAAHLALGFGFLLVYGLGGCAAPKAIQDAEKAGERSLAGYVAATDEIVHQVLDGYRREARAHAETKFRQGLGSATGPDGKIPSETVFDAIKELRRIEAEIDQETRKAEVAIAKARLDLEDARDFRAAVRRWLDAEGVSPEAARQIGDLILERVK